MFLIKARVLLDAVCKLEEGQLGVASTPIRRRSWGFVVHESRSNPGCFPGLFVGCLVCSIGSLYHGATLLAA